MNVTADAPDNDPKIFYRVLPDDKDHVARWRAKQFTSFHHVPPGQWLKTWGDTGSTCEADYSLTSGYTIFAPSARTHFLWLVQTYGAPEQWPEEQRKFELPGVCAFRTASAALANAECHWRFPDGIRFAEFLGKYICPAPEDEERSVVAEVREVCAFRTVEAFRLKHEL